MVGLMLHVCLQRNGPHHVIGELCYKRTTLQKNYRKLLMNYREITILWSFFPIIPFVKFHGKKMGVTKSL